MTYLCTLLEHLKPVRVLRNCFLNRFTLGLFPVFLASFISLQFLKNPFYEPDNHAPFPRMKEHSGSRTPLHFRRDENSSSAFATFCQ